jgi:hypothetical protein
LTVIYSRGQWSLYAWVRAGRTPPQPLLPAKARAQPASLARACLWRPLVASAVTAGGEPGGRVLARGPRAPSTAEGGLSSEHAVCSTPGPQPAPASAHTGLGPPPITGPRLRAVFLRFMLRKQVQAPAFAARATCPRGRAGVCPLPAWSAVQAALGDAPPAR